MEEIKREGQLGERTMDWTDTIRYIQKMRRNNRLVIFVGSGVSANSGIPTWGALISAFAEKLGYEHTLEHSFTQEEMLRIPEYFWLQDTSAGHRAYFDLIKDTLNCEKRANSIDDMIFRLMPHHIITTNYDPLLERSGEINARLYSVVAKDKDILSGSSERYLLKMHGDLSSPEDIVLKESDYTNYEQTHVLITTYLKALLIDHSFLFLGYSLNDYNLRLIIGWINYYCGIHGVKDRPYHFIVQSEPANAFEEARLRGSRLMVVDIGNLPEHLLQETRIPADLEDPRGRRLYAWLNCIYDPKLLDTIRPLKEVLEEKYEVLRSYRKIAVEDLLQVHPLGDAGRIGERLCLREKEWYRRLSGVLKGEMQEAVAAPGNAEETGMALEGCSRAGMVPGLYQETGLVLDTFQRAGISGIFCPETGEAMELSKKERECRELFSLYLDNRYRELEGKLKNCREKEAVCYYRYLLRGKAPEGEEEGKSVCKDYVSVLLEKMRRRMYHLSWCDRQEALTEEIEQLFSSLPASYKMAVQYLEKIFSSMAGNLKAMEELLGKQEERYSCDNSVCHANNDFEELLALQAYAFEYYEFFKQNFLPLDGFFEPRIYFSYYLRAVLCSWSPVIKIGKTDWLGIRRTPKPYLPGEIDLDMFVKYTKPEELEKWIRQYKASGLRMQESARCVEKFAFFCENYLFWDERHAFSGRRSRENQIASFLLLLGCMELTAEERKTICDKFLNLTKALAEKQPREFPGIFQAAEIFSEKLLTGQMTQEKRRLADVMLNPGIYEPLLKEHKNAFVRLVSSLADCVPEERRLQLMEMVDKADSDREKCCLLFLFRKLLPAEKYREYLQEHLDCLDGRWLLHFVAEKRIPYSQAVLNRYLDIITSEAERRRRQPGVRFYPDSLVSAVEDCILLKLLGVPVELEVLRPYEEYSDHLKFLLDPDGFDYSRIDLNHYMWKNIFYHREYQDCLKAHRADILTEELEKLFSMRMATESQQKIVYGILLDERELWGYGGIDGI